MNITTKLINDGNSTMVRIPKIALELSGLSGIVDIVVNDGEIILKQSKTVRFGWDKAIIADKPIVDAELSDWDVLLTQGIA